MGKIKLDTTSEQNILNMLMESSSISNEQMTKINNTSAEIGKTKLETAFELNFADEDKILQVLSANYSLPIIDLKKTVIDPKIKKIIDIRYIEDNSLVPFEMGNGVLKIAIADASKLSLMKNLKTMTKMEPELYAASISNINSFIERFTRTET
ncbi:MAG: type II/IV secretion system protein, partial [Pelagibacteraceae bacterium]|nr:type II/IV secretion system protein [Pelagibacteraceae bacterium]